MADFCYDFLVIGAGPEGEAAAIAAAKIGLSVGVVVDSGLFGGNCTHRGTIPSKALRHAVKQVVLTNAQPIFRYMGLAKQLSYAQVLDAASKVIPKQVDQHLAYLTKNQVHIHNGLAISW